MEEYWYEFERFFVFYIIFRFLLILRNCILFLGNFSLFVVCRVGKLGVILACRVIIESYGSDKG